MSARHLVFGLTLAGSLAATSAPAAVVRITFSGVVSDGSDVTGVFGAAGSDLGGKAFTAVFTLDEAAGTSHYDLPRESEIENGGGVTLTIGGISNHIAGDTWNLSGAFSNVTSGALPNSGQVPFGAYGLMHFKLNDGFDRCQGGAGDCPDYSLLHLLYYSFTDPFLTTGDYRTPFSRTAQPDDITQGQFSIERYFVPDNPPPGGPFIEPTERAFGTLTVRAVQAVLVPEPATWAVLVLGFGATGAMLRRRRHLTLGPVRSHHPC